MHGFCHQLPIVREKATKPIVWEQYSYFSHSMGAFFPSSSHLMVYFIIWEQERSCNAAFSGCHKNFCGFANIIHHISLKMGNKVNKILK